MSDKSVLCLVCGHFTPPQAAGNPERIGGPGEPYTYHRACARVALDEAEAEFRAAGGRGVDLAEEIDWLRAKLGGAQ
jgi:hypothetical protein